MIHRILEENIRPLLDGNKAIIIMGARQVGKSTLLKQLLGENKDVLWLNGDDIDIQNLFREMSSTRMRALLGNNKYLVIDEHNVFRTSGFVLNLSQTRYLTYRSLRQAVALLTLLRK